MLSEPALLSEVIKALAGKRTVFHSEADFQHAFAWELHSRFPESSVRIERPLRTIGSRTLHLDFLIQFSGKSVAVELKYKTKRLVQDIAEERYDLAHHGAHDVGGYDFIKDICRLEEICTHIENCDGWAIMLTNDASYWKKPSTNAYADFRLTEGRILHGAIGWPDGTVPGTKRNREQVLQLAGTYTLNWNDYATINDGAHVFKYLALRVKST